MSKTRRAVLRAAATTAPLIATLPCGAAFANASAHQCIDSALSKTATGEITLIRQRADEYIRVVATQRRIGQAQYFKVLDQWYSPDGTPIDPPPGGKDRQVHVAVAFQPSEDLGTVDKLTVRFDAFEPNTTALTGSCWTSAAPSAGDFGGGSILGT